METREKIIAAAGRVMRDRGLARATTKEISREAGYSEGAIYKHFESKEELFVRVLTEDTSQFVGVLGELSGRVGREDMTEVLGEVAASALDFYGETFAMSASIFSEPGLLARHRVEIRRLGTGPQKANEILAAYLEAERNLDRIHSDTDPEAAAAMLLGACFQRAFLNSFSGEEESPKKRAEFTESIVRNLMRSISPREE